MKQMKILGTAALIISLQLFATSIRADSGGTDVTADNYRAKAATKALENTKQQTLTDAQLRQQLVEQCSILITGMEQRVVWMDYRRNGWFMFGGGLGGVIGATGLAVTTVAGVAMATALIPTDTPLLTIPPDISNQRTSLWLGGLGTALVGGVVFMGGSAFSAASFGTSGILYALEEGDDSEYQKRIIAAQESIWKLQNNDIPLKDIAPCVGVQPRKNASEDSILRERDEQRRLMREDNELLLEMVTLNKALAGQLRSQAMQDGAKDGRCFGNGTCNEGLSCIENLCKELDAGTKDGKCYGNNTCNDGLDCSDGKCVPAEGSEGGSCMADDLCNDGLKCLADKCTAIAPGDKGGVCNKGESCTGELACSSENKCVAPVKSSGACSAATDVCIAGSQCVDGKCVEVAAGKDGGKCMGSDNECDAELTCVEGFCKKEPSS